MSDTLQGSAPGAAWGVGLTSMASLWVQLHGIIVTLVLSPHRGTDGMF